MEKTRGRARFGAFDFDPESGELRQGDSRSRLQPQPARVLELLLKRAGEVVTREELKREVWPDTVVEFDQGLNYCIRQIRAALGDAADVPRYVETLARRGYRFIEPVEWDAPVRPHRPLRAAPIAVAAGGTLVLIAWLAAGSPPGEPVPAAPSIRVAVLPLRENRAGNPLTESLVAALTNSGAGLDVVGPASTSRFQGDRRSETAIGAELNVSYLISGGIRSTDSGLFIQVVRVGDGAHIFAEIVPRSLVRSDTTLARVAADVAGRLRQEVGPAGGTR